MRLTWRELALLAGLAFFGFWNSSWNLPLFDLDEGAFSQATQEMLASDNFLITTLDGAPRYDKPMLTYWLQGAAVTALGDHEFVFRLHSMMAATVWMLLLFFFVRRRDPDGAAPWVAAGGLALGLASSLIGHAATADALLNLLLAATLLDLYRYYEAPQRAIALRVFLWMGLGLLVKGPVAVAIPAVVSAVFFVWQGRGRDWLRGVCEWRGWLLLAAVVLPWAVANWMQDGGEWIRRFLFEHNVDRYGETMEGHGGVWYYYLVALPLIVLPFTHLLPGALRRGLRGDALDRFCLIWFGIVLLLFSFSQTQLPHYLLYGATPLFILFGRQSRQLPVRGWLLLPGFLLIAVLLALPALLSRLSEELSRPREIAMVADAIAAIGWQYWLAGGVAALLCGIALRLSRPRALLTVALAQSVFVWFGVMPVLAAAHQEPTRQAALYARTLDVPVVRYATKLPSFSVYRGAPTPHRMPAPGEVAFVTLDRVEQLRQAVAPDTLRIEFAAGAVLLVRREPCLCDRP